MNPKCQSWLYTLLLFALSNESAAQLAQPETQILSPAYWNEDARTFFEEFNQTINVEKPLATGTRGAITATGHAPAVYSGFKALEQGGTAADAVVTTALAQVVLAAGSSISYSGYWTMVYYEADTRSVYSLDAGYNSVLGETDPLTIPSDEASGRTVLVPGFMAGIEATHQQFGKLPWSTLFEPAIYYAEEGFKLPRVVAGFIRFRADVHERLPETRAIFTKPDGSAYAAGDVFRQPQVAQTLRSVAANGAEFMYTGQWGERFVEAVQREGGRISKEDMAAYQVIWSDPLTVRYGNKDVVVSGLPAHGGVQMVETLNLASEVGLPRMGHFAETPESFFWLSQIANLFALSQISQEQLTSLEKRLGMDLSLAARATDAHAVQMLQKIREGQVPYARTPTKSTLNHSNAIVAADQWGNVAAVTHTINMGAGFIGLFVDGVSVNESASIQKERLAQIEPGARVPASATPLVIIGEDGPVAALSSIGGALHQATLSVVINLLDGQMGIKEAIDAPSLHAPAWNTATRTFKPQVLDGDFSDEVLDEVRALGIDVQVMPRGFGAARGYVVGIMRDPQTGILHAAGSRPLNALPLAY